MEKLKASEVLKPKFVSEVEIKTRPEMRVVSLPGKGDPMRAFNKKARKLYEWLSKKEIKPIGPTLGIYYLNRDEVGVENIKWDACVPVSEQVETEGEIKFQALSEAKVVSTILTGGYDLIGPALKYLEAVAQVNGVEARWPLTEIYLQEEEEPVTELQYFVFEES